MLNNNFCHSRKICVTNIYWIQFLDTGLDVLETASKKAVEISEDDFIGHFR